MRPSVVFLLLLYYGGGHAKKVEKQETGTPAKGANKNQCEMLGRRYLRHCQCGLSDLGLLTAAFIGKPTQVNPKDAVFQGTGIEVRLADVQVYIWDLAPRSFSAVSDMLTSGSPEDTHAIFQSASPVNYLEFDMLRRQLEMQLTEIKSVKRLVMQVLKVLDGVVDEQSKMSLRQSTDAGPTVVIPKETCLPIRHNTCPGHKYTGHISCTDILLSGTNTSGIYTIYPRFLNTSFPVFCDMETNGGGWTVIQRRINGSIKFFRPWKDYKEGFGDLEGEFWLGNDNIHLLTRSFGSTLLRIMMETFEGHWHVAQFDGFKIGNESQNYKLTAGRFTYGSNVADSFSYHDGAHFSTFDRDNDGDQSVNCGKKGRGGWWYRGGMPSMSKCGLANPNGLYHLGAYEGDENGIYWYFWRSDYMYSFRKVVMMVRPSHYYYSSSLPGYQRPPSYPYNPVPPPPYPYPYPNGYAPQPYPYPNDPAPQPYPYPYPSDPAPAPYPNYPAASGQPSSNYYYQRDIQGDQQGDQGGTQGDQGGKHEQ